MGKKKSCLGNSLIKKYSEKTPNQNAKGESRHTLYLADGSNFNRLNLRSVTEQSSLDDFLETVTIAEKEFSAEHENVKFVTQDVAHEILSEAEKNEIMDAQERHKHMLQIPRRPKWDETTTKEELLGNEDEAFLVWRRKLAQLRQEKHISLTPYEKNLEVWKQLWRVIERSDVIVQILDARNPLLFRCEDLEAYVKEIDETKLNVLLLNKSDFLTEEQRKLWAAYFSNIGVKVIFFSALQQMQEAELAKSEDDKEVDESSSEDGENEAASEYQNDATPDSNSTVKNSTKLLSRDELIDFLKGLGKSVQDSSKATIGLVGYPNVGKSSTINAVFLSKKVCVSATPGKTKHFQTLLIDSDLCFCDCPGLVFPNFVSTKAEMVVNGILPIDRLINHVPSVTLVVNLIPRHVLQATYAIMIPPPAEGKDPTSPPTAEEFLNSHGYMRGFMTQRGLPDNARSARFILKDFVNGKLLHCHAPPGVKQDEYHVFESAVAGSAKPKMSGQSIIYSKSASHLATKIDKETFCQKNFQVSIKGNIGLRGLLSSRNANKGSFLKDTKKHMNRNSKEKVRRNVDKQAKRERREDEMFAQL